MKLRSLVLLAAVLAAACKTTAPAPAADSAEFQIESTVLASYNVVSGPAGRHDWDRFKGLFAPGARITVVKVTGESAATSTDEYATSSQVYLAEHALFEHPIATRVERFGDFAQVLSTYESRQAASDAAPEGRGVRSFQLVRQGDRWLITSVVSQVEDAVHPIPAAYLPQ